MMGAAGNLGRGGGRWHTTNNNTTNERDGFCLFGLPHLLGLGLGLGLRLPCVCFCVFCLGSFSPCSFSSFSSFSCFFGSWKRLDWWRRLCQCRRRCHLANVPTYTRRRSLRQVPSTTTTYPTQRRWMSQHQQAIARMTFCGTRGAASAGNCSRQTSTSFRTTSARDSSRRSEAARTRRRQEVSQSARVCTSSLCVGWTRRRWQIARAFCFVRIRSARHVSATSTGRVRRAVVARG